MKKANVSIYGRGSSKPYGDSLKDIEIIKKQIANVVVIGNRRNRPFINSELFKKRIFIGHPLEGHPFQKVPSPLKNVPSKN